MYLVVFEKHPAELMKSATMAGGKTIDKVESKQDIKSKLTRSY